MKNIGSIAIPLAFVLLCGYSLSLGEWLDAVMYMFVGGGFTVINLIKEKKITENLTFWNRLSWTLVLLSAVLFMAVLFNDANKEILAP